MQPHDEAARRERQRAAGMRRWPSSLFLADEQHFRILESPELNRCEFSEAVLKMFNHKFMWGQNQAEAGRIREEGQMLVGGFKVTPGTIIGGFEMVPGPLVRGQLMAFINDLNDRFRNATDFVELAVWAHYEVVRIHPFFDGNGRAARLFMNLILRRGMGCEPCCWSMILRSSDISTNLIDIRANIDDHFMLVSGNRSMPIMSLICATTYLDSRCYNATR
ncbi:hypothetical protein niasHT_018241 [Heterodera trifolii]|uniref:Fido domain-containing protein n=1 Tax=Heterodera trifolii TaxID=157864 RepID=A0ABD2L5R8_9BILA